MKGRAPDQFQASRATIKRLGLFEIVRKKAAAPSKAVMIPSSCGGIL